MGSEEVMRERVWGDQRQWGEGEIDCSTYLRTLYAHACNVNQQNSMHTQLSPDFKAIGKASPLSN
jgi:hypothetical protein